MAINPRKFGYDVTVRASKPFVQILAEGEGRGGLSQGNLNGGLSGVDVTFSRQGYLKQNVKEKGREQELKGKEVAKKIVKERRG